MVRDRPLVQMFAYFLQLQVGKDYGLTGTVVKPFCCQFSYADTRGASTVTLRLWSCSCGWARTTG